MVTSLKSWRPSGRVHGRWGWMHTALVTSLFQWTAAQLSITPDVVTAEVGDTVTLSLQYEGHLQNFTWFRRRGTDEGGPILTVIGSRPPDYGFKSTGRETALGNGSLRITDVQTGDTGTYTVRVNGDPLQEATAQLIVQARSEALTGPDEVTGTVGGSVSVECRYAPENRGYHKYWCRGKGPFCATLIKTSDSLQEVRRGRVTIRDSPQTGTFTVTMEGLRRGDAGTYGCGIDRPSAPNHLFPVSLVVLTVPEAGGNTIQTSTPAIVSVPEKAPKTGGNNIRTSTLMTDSIPERGAPPAADTPCTSWWVPLAVALGMLVSAALVVLGVVLFYERRLKKVNGATPGGNPSVISEPAIKYENVQNGNQVQSAAQSTDADPTYMALTHEDQTTYGYLQRPQN